MFLLFVYVPRPTNQPLSLFSDVILNLGVPSKQAQEGHHCEFSAVYRLPQYPLLHVHRLP